MKSRFMFVIVFGLLPVLMAGTVAAQDTSRTACALQLTAAYISDWRYDHATDDGSVDVQAMARAAGALTAALSESNLSCTDTYNDLKSDLLTSLEQEYPAEDIARLLTFMQEALGEVDSYSCAFDLTQTYLRRVDWDDTPLVQIGRTTVDVYRTVRDAASGGACYGWPLLLLLQTTIENYYSLPADPTFVQQLYAALTAVTSSPSTLSADDCGYQLADLFLTKVDWGDESPDVVVKVVGEATKSAYAIGGRTTCDRRPVAAITQMVLAAVDTLPPDATILKTIADAAQVAK